MASGLRCSIPWLLAVAIGCGGGDIDAPIPCKSGECPTAFTCVAATNLCVKGGMIGTPDAPLLDAPASDAPPSSDGGCVSDPACAGATSAGPTCSDATHHVTCSQAASGCFTVTAGPVACGPDQTMWQRSVPATMMALADARSYCAGLSLAGFSDWRLPTRIELVSLVDYGRAGLTIDTTAFSATPPSPFWSASTYVARAGEAWAVDFGDGDAFGNDVTGALYVRCVR